MIVTLKNISLALLTISLFAPVMPVMAQNSGNPTGGQFAKRHPRRNEVNRRVQNQRRRINQGVKSGKLTPQQAQQLRTNDLSIKKQEHEEVKANGGYLTKAQQQQLNQEENANSKMIHDEAHPGQ